MDIIQLLDDNKNWIFSGIGLLFITPIINHFFNKNKSTTIINNYNNEKVNPKSEQFDVENKKDIQTYSKIVGQRHKQLRENVLELSKREMTDFYKLDSVTTLEKYESGETELPLKKIEQLEDFFFINKNYLELGKMPIFNSFHLSQDNINNFFNKGFLPMIICSPVEREHFLYAYIVLYKIENNFTRMIISNLPGSFRSNGGGKMNILSLIFAMKENKMNKYEISILKADEQAFNNIEKGIGYKKNLFHSLGCADYECADIFHKWFDE